MKNISEIQRIEGQIVRLSSFNNFDGNAVVDYLYKQDYVQSFAMRTESERDAVLSIRDLKDDREILSTLYIKIDPTASFEEINYIYSDLENVFDADEVDITDESPRAEGVVIRVWWD